MPRPPIDLHQKIRELLQHTVALPPESAAPVAHYEWSTNEVFNLMAYVRSHLERTPVYERVYNRHMSQLRRLALVSLVESFERLLKELAALCIDNLVSYVADDRFEKRGVSGGQIAAHFGAGTVGKALSESDTWLTNRTINERFRSLILTELHQQSPGIFDAQAKADSLSRHFGLPLTVDTAGGSL